MSVRIPVLVPGAPENEGENEGESDAGYDVVVGHGLVDAVPAALPHAQTVAVVGTPAVRQFAAGVAAACEAVGRRVVRLEAPDGEAAKDLAVAGELWAGLGAAAVSRRDAVVAVGGGALTDVVGFVAATWLRGIDVVHVPTTLLGMVDAAIGGKTALNTAAGKNLVGAFHQPRAVVCDLDALASLDPRELAAGLAEVVKAGFLADPVILELVESNDPDAVGTHLAELVERAARVKADVVSADPHESGRREVLNYGHTLAHALEHDAGYGRWRHGDAVSVGLCYAAGLARRLGLLDDATAARHAATLDRLGLPTRYDASAWPRLRSAMAVDKKTRGGSLRFVLLEGLARPTVVADIDEAVLEAAYAEVAG